MRRAILALLLCWPAAASAQPRNVAVADLGLHVIGVGVQRTLATHLAGQLDLDYYSPWTQLKADGDAVSDVAGVVVRARVFRFLHEAPTGWWLSPFAQLGRAGHGITLWAAGASIGHAWLFGAWSLSVGAGVQYHSAQPYFAGAWPHLDLIAGRTF